MYLLSSGKIAEWQLHLYTRLLRLYKNLCLKVFVFGKSVPETTILQVSFTSNSILEPKSKDFNMGKYVNTITAKACYVLLANQLGNLK